ncbi:MAG: multiheme c-type cytochrome [Rubripirellula sp.]
MKLWDRSLRAYATFASLMVMLIGTSVSAQEPTKWDLRLNDPIYLSWLGYDKIGECVECHLSPPIKLSGNKDGFGTLSRRVEMEKWLTMDKHTIARRRVEPFDSATALKQIDVIAPKWDAQRAELKAQLTEADIKFNPNNNSLVKGVQESWVGASNVLSRRICDKLWGNGSVTKKEGYDKFRENCLTCHGGYQGNPSGFEFDQVANAQLGIDCNFCHQLGENNAWVEVHDVQEKWRMKTPAEKEAAGLRNLVDTGNQATLCMDCHVGNRSKNMFVTHQMYAAGHPPLPSIELEEFCKEMPQHWQTPSQLYESLAGFKDRDRYFAINYPGLGGVKADGVFWNTRKMLVGALTARKKSLELLIDSADAHRWADYSLYDCAACHHELQSQSVRQFRGFPAAPGRPRQHEWPDAVLQIAYAYVFHKNPTSKSSMQGLEAQLTAAIGEQPFGDQNRVRPIAEQLRGRLDLAIAEMENKPVTANIAKAVLVGLSRAPEQRIFTYDSARQVIWAMQTIVREMKQKGAPIDAQVSTIVMALGDESTAGVAAKIPSGRKQFIFPTSLEADLNRRANFSPSRLKTQLNRINQLLSASLNQKRSNLVSK